jgi:cell division protein FtsW (lipid II flippase)
VSIGPLNFQPGEIAKVLLVIFFAAYLADNRELLAAGSVRIGRIFVPALRHLGPLALAWGFSILVMVYEKDLGSSLLFFGVFAAMLYMATGRGYYLFVGLILFLIGAALAYAAFGHVQVRVDTWINPWRDPTHTGFQIIQSWYAFGTGGFAGTGLGLGNPDKIPNAATAFVYSEIAEELGLLGTVGVLIAFMLFVGSAYRIAVDAVRPFAKLFAAGIATIIGFQTVIILGGVMRVIPLTGITLPFVSYGGSSLVANFVALALLRASRTRPHARCRAASSIRRRPVNATIRRRLNRNARAVPRARRRRRTCRSCGPTISRTTRTTSASSSATTPAPAAHPSARIARSSPSRCRRPVTSSRSVCIPRDRAAVRARRRVPGRQPRQHRRRGRVQRRASSAATSTSAINDISDFFSGKTHRQRRAHDGAEGPEGRG